ncbi:VIT1/CCC1 transporter family protein [Psychrobacter pygoscelis]|uniref:VIT1/CCC1 transporter family protein n=1 Tax=Psychrobacter pygoscelis TaxID=2488563 RepID=UPI001F6026B0|nr:VIT1/CCC1 transporter family protein [Psychrobacter pygoscelis]
MTEGSQARPFQATVTSALSFMIGAIIPIIGILLLPMPCMIWSLAILTLVGLIILGIASAKLGGAPIMPATSRVVIWGILAMLATSLIGRLFGVTVSTLH